MIKFFIYKYVFSFILQRNEDYLSTRAKLLYVRQSTFIIRFLLYTNVRSQCVAAEYYINQQSTSIFLLLYNRALSCIFFILTYQNRRICPLASFKRKRDSLDQATFFHWYNVQIRWWALVGKDTPMAWRLLIPLIHKVQCNEFCVPFTLLFRLRERFLSLFAIADIVGCWCFLFSQISDDMYSTKLKLSHPAIRRVLEKDSS